MEITCGIFLQRYDDLVLFIHPTLAPEHFISIPKGIYENEDETYFNAAKRELLEETGINLDNYTYQLTEIPGFYKYQQRNKKLKAFIVKIEDDINEELVCNSYFDHEDEPIIEADAFYWINPHTIHMFSSSCRSLHHTQQEIINVYFPSNAMPN